LLVVIALLASAVTAYAECAWVLWTEVNQKYLRPDSPHARTNEQYPKWEFDTNVQLTFDACESQLSRKMSDTVKIFTEGPGGAKLFEPPGDAPDFFVRIWERDRRVAIQRQGVFFLIYTYACLPDTLDPRGPKGR
jgi:hypothetical protein